MTMPLPPIFKNRMKNAIAGLALGATLALAGVPAGAADATAEMDAAREACIADSKAKSASLLKLAQTKRAAAADYEKAGESDKAKVEMEKVARLETKIKESVEICLESKRLDARIASADAEAVKLEIAGKLVTEINNELIVQLTILEGLEKSSIPVEQRKTNIGQLKKFLDSAIPRLASARREVVNKEYGLTLAELEKHLKQLASRLSKIPN
jgi:hypothetical protein